MNQYVTGAVIRRLREESGLTQEGLADKLCVSPKTVSKWETGRGYPDITMLELLSQALGISVIELLSGNEIRNKNRSGHMLRTALYVCPVCGNVIHAVGDATVSCCGISLIKEEEEEPDEAHAIRVEGIEDEWYVTMNHPMTKDHFISFFMAAGTDGIRLTKLYPEQNAACRFPVRGTKRLYAFCNRHGLFAVKIRKTR